MDSEQEIHRLKKLLDESKKENVDLEVKLTNVQKLLDQEKEKRKWAEEEIIKNEKQLQMVRDCFLSYNRIHDEIKEKLKFLNSTNKDMSNNNNPLTAIQELDSTESVLSDNTLSDDILDAVMLKKRTSKEHCPSVTKGAITSSTTNFTPMVAFVASPQLVESDEKKNCSRCERPVTNPKGGVTCAVGCSGYFHVQCTRLATIQNLAKMGRKKLNWKCDICILKSANSPAENKDPAKTPKRKTVKRQPVERCDEENRNEELITTEEVSNQQLPVYNFKRAVVALQDCKNLPNVLNNSNVKSDEKNCSRCKQPVTNLKGGVTCAVGCSGYFHVECTRLVTIQNLARMGKKKLNWKCDICIKQKSANSHAENKDIKHLDENKDIKHLDENKDTSHLDEHKDTSHPAENQNTSRPAKNKDTSCPAKNKDTSHPAENKDTSSPAKNKDTGRPAKNKDISHPDENKDTSQPAENKDTVRPAKNKHTSHPDENKDTSHPAENKDTGRPAENTDTGHSDDNKYSSHSGENKDTGSPAKNTDTGHSDDNKDSSLPAKIPKLSTVPKLGENAKESRYSESSQENIYEGSSSEEKSISHKSSCTYVSDSEEEKNHHEKRLENMENKISGSREKLNKKDDVAGKDTIESPQVEIIGQVSQSEEKTVAVDEPDRELETINDKSVEKTSEAQTSNTLTNLDPLDKTKETEDTSCLVLSKSICQEQGNGVVTETVHCQNLESSKTEDQITNSMKRASSETIECLLVESPNCTKKRRTSS